MSRAPHPFTEMPPPHPGWHVYHFEFGEREWQLTTINAYGDAHSLLSNDAERPEPWPCFDTMSLEGIVSVEACITIIRMAFSMWEAGHRTGYAQCRFDIQKALGLAS